MYDRHVSDSDEATLSALPQNMLRHQCFNYLPDRMFVLQLSDSTIAEAKHDEAEATVNVPKLM